MPDFSGLHGYKTYIIRVIIPEGKNKSIQEETQVAFSYRKDENNNLIFENKYGELIYEYHNYNWLGVGIDKSESSI